MSFALFFPVLFLFIIFFSLIIYVFYPAISTASGQTEETKVKVISQPDNKTEKGKTLFDDPLIVWIF